MQTLEAQPNAAPLSDALLDAVLGALPDPAAHGPVREARFRDGHSNDVMEVRFADGAALVVKRGRYDWAAERFRTAAHAGRLVTRHTRVRAPVPVEIPGDLCPQPLQAYWRIDLPTLDQVWPSLDARGRRLTLRSWGRVTRRLHGVRARGHGAIHDGAEPAGCAAEWVRGDLEERLLPSMHCFWPDGVPALHAALERVPGVAERAEGRPAVVLHRDLHMGNVLCRPGAGRARCVGLLDLETAAGGLPEMDAAVAEVLHGPLFGQALPEGWVDEWLGGYGDTDPWLRAFYRVYHLLNQGYYSGFVGHAEHAAEVGKALHAELDALSGPRRYASRGRRAAAAATRTRPTPCPSAPPSSTSTSTTRC